MQFLAITFFLIMPILGVASFRGYEFTDSAEFCGTICHNMDPQYTRYQQSPHARVTCAGCHIGPGPGAFVKAKVSGLRQVYFTVLGRLSQADSPGHHRTSPGPGNVRAMPLAVAVLRLAAAKDGSLRPRRKQHPPRIRNPGQGRRIEQQPRRRRGHPHAHARSGRVCGR